MEEAADRERDAEDADVDGIGQLCHARQGRASGAALSGANPKNLALTFAASTAIANAGLDGADAVIAVLTFVAIGSVSPSSGRSSSTSWVRPRQHDP